VAGTENAIWRIIFNEMNAHYDGVRVVLTLDERPPKSLFFNAVGQLFGWDTIGLYTDFIV